MLNSVSGSLPSGPTNLIKAHKSILRRRVLTFTWIILLIHSSDFYTCLKKIETQNFARNRQSEWYSKETLIYLRSKFWNINKKH